MPKYVGKIVSYTVVHVSSTKDIDGDITNVIRQDNDKCWVSKRYATDSTLLIDIGPGLRLTKVGIVPDFVHTPVFIKVLASKQQDHLEEKYREIGTLRFHYNQYGIREEKVYCDTEQRWILLRIGESIPSVENLDERVGIRKVTIWACPVKGSTDSEETVESEPPFSGERSVHYGDNEYCSEDEESGSESTTKYCGKCGEKRSLYDKYCINCGRKHGTT